MKTPKATYKEVTNKKDKEIIGLIFRVSDLETEIAKLQKENTELKEDKRKLQNEIIEKLETIKELKEKLKEQDNIIIGFMGKKVRFEK